MQHAGNLGDAPGANVDHGTHGGAGARNAAKESSGDVADPLADKFPVGAVTRSRHVVRHQRGEQAVDRAKNREDERRLKHNQHGVVR